jgi:hypothetical protein
MPGRAFNVLVWPKATRAAATSTSSSPPGRRQNGKHISTSSSTGSACTSSAGSTGSTPAPADPHHAATAKHRHAQKALQVFKRAETRGDRASQLREAKDLAVRHGEGKGGGVLSECDSGSSTDTGTKDAYAGSEWRRLTDELQCMRSALLLIPMGLECTELASHAQAHGQVVQGTEGRWNRARHVDQVLELAACASQTIQTRNMEGCDAQTLQLTL